MTEKATTQKQAIKKIATYVGIPVLSLAALIIISSLSFAYYYNDKIFPGVYVGDIDLSTHTKKEARALLQDSIQDWNNGLHFKVVSVDGDVIDDFEVPQTVSDSEQGLLYTMYGFKVDDMVDQAYNVGRSYNVITNVYHQVHGLFSQTRLTFLYDFDDEHLNELLTKRFEFTGVIQKPQDADIQVSMYTNSQYTVQQKGAKEGFLVNFAKLDHNIRRALEQNTYKTFNVAQEQTPALVSSELLTTFEEQIQEIIDRGNINLQNGDVSWEIVPTIYGNWLGVVYDNGSIRLSFRKDDVIAYLEKVIKPAIDKDSVNARFQITDGKVSSFKASQAGQELLIEESYTILEDTFFNQEKNIIPLAISTVKPEITTEDANTLGIKEIIGVGRSNMVGSPANRRHNIAIGAAAVNGTVIAPGEEFSLLKVLGNIDASNGYRQELVIKGNKTIPEYGGGLCQIGTTTFRGALDAGLKITQRQNHSYRVSYYEPAGTDATIYDPAPDFRFLNDTPNHILILTRIEGNELIWEYWGTKDGRKVNVEKPKIFNIIKPPPTKIVETDELPPGEKKCTERAHNGATATLTRSVTYADGTENTETWTSVYRPWQEVCLVGKAKEVLTDAVTQDPTATEGAQLLEEDGVHVPQEPVI